MRNLEWLCLGNLKISARLFIFETRSSIAFINPSPLLPGHIVVAPIQSKKRICDLTGSEFQDIFLVVKIITGSMKSKCDGFTIYMQDEDSTGKKIGHVYLHVVPRTKKDLENNDDIYKKGALKIETANTDIRHLEDQADALRKLLKNTSSAF